MGAGKMEIRQWNHFHIAVIASEGTTNMFNLLFTAIKVQIDHQILMKLHTHKICYEDPGNKTDWFMKKLVC